MYPTADSLETALLRMQTAFGVSRNDLLPLVMEYQNTLIHEMEIENRGK